MVLLLLLLTAVRVTTERGHHVALTQMQTVMSHTLRQPLAVQTALRTAGGMSTARELDDMLLSDWPRATAVTVSSSSSSSSGSSSTAVTVLITSCSSWRRQCTSWVTQTAVCMTVLLLLQLLLVLLMLLMMAAVLRA
jgi:hypothetical protein